ncbi:MAG: hypothetical protein CM1200mP1_12780 [Candidatus Neomarinimicrobiota bacterium]|nr:MAG: hypothetical protein CM1200mP1_12780 [Candidatus Neomarinimicrobiota bacterium]
MSNEFAVSALARAIDKNTVFLAGTYVEGISFILDTFLFLGTFILFEVSAEPPKCSRLISIIE